MYFRSLNIGSWSRVSRNTAHNYYPLPLETIENKESVLLNYYREIEDDHNISVGGIKKACIELNMHINMHIYIYMYAYNINMLTIATCNYS